MEGFAWAENNLGAETPHHLQNRGVNVYFAPEIPYETKVVNLANGRVERFATGEHRPEHGYYADESSLERFCREHGIPFSETNGQASVEPFNQLCGSMALPCFYESSTTSRKLDEPF